MSNMPFIFFGTPYVARDTLIKLVSGGYRPALVVTSAPAPAGRGNVMTECVTSTWAKENGIPVFSPSTLDKEAQEHILSFECPYAIVVAYGKILPRALIDAFPNGAINVHYSLLPKYRGASPVESVLRNGDRVTGVTIQKMIFELDAGDILSARETLISPEETTPELRARLIELGANLLLEILPAYLGGELKGVPQEHQLATHVGKINKDEGELSLKGNAVDNWQKYKAFKESPTTYFYAERNGERIRVKIVSAIFTEGAFTPTRVIPAGKNEQDFIVFANNGWKIF